jgi:spore maturation protein CgeB
MIAAGFSPSVRLFEASACGSTILSDSWSGLEEFLTPNEEILLPHDQYEVANIMQTMLEEDRVKMGRRARERILAQHSSQHRAAQFENIVDSCRRNSHHVRGSRSTKERMQSSDRSVCSVSNL